MEQSEQMIVNNDMIFEPPDIVVMIQAIGTITR